MKSPIKMMDRSILFRTGRSHKSCYPSADRSIRIFKFRDEISREAMAKITPSVSFFTVAIHVLVSFLLTYAYEIPGTSRVIVRINGTRCRVLYRSGIYFSSRESAGTPRQCIRSW